MARPAKPKNEKLADALRAAKLAADGGHVFRKKSLNLAQTRILSESGWILEIHAGWVTLVTPSAKEGDTVPYYSNYWEFIQKYLDNRLGKDYILGPVPSLALHTDSYAIPKQLAVITNRTTHGLVSLPHDTSLMVISDPKSDLSGLTIFGGLQVHTIERALAALPASSFRIPSTELTAAIATVHNIPELSRHLLKTNGTAAGRVIAAMKDIGRSKDAQIIESAFRNAGIEIPTNIESGIFDSLSNVENRLKSSIAARLKALWKTMSDSLVDARPPKANPDSFRKATAEEIKNSIDEIYANDAYNSLSIEGYQVTPVLIERVASGSWDPDKIQQDRETMNALAARGYYEAFNSTVQTIIDIHSGAPDIDTIERAALEWRSLLFSPAAKAGLLPPDSLAGYRHNPVYIRGSMHVPPPHEKLMDAMDTLYDLLREEKNPWTRAVLGHFFLVYIHPFPDGNGRTARFLMNAVLVTAGYQWTIVRVSQRTRYFAALEKASINGDPWELSAFLIDEMNACGKER